MKSVAMNCKTCFFHRYAQGHGIDKKTLKANGMVHYCHRYPRKIVIEGFGGHFCGEYWDGKKKKVSGYLSDKAFMTQYNSDMFRKNRGDPGIFISEAEHKRFNDIKNSNKEKK